MCGRVNVETSLNDMMKAFAQADDDVTSMANQFPRWNGAPGLYCPIIVSDVVREPDAL